MLVRKIVESAEIDQEHKMEILDIVNLLMEYNVIESVQSQRP